MAATPATQNKVVARPTTREQAIELYREWVTLVPLGEGGDEDGVIADVFLAQSPFDVGSSESLPNAEDLDGQDVKVLAVWRHEGSEEFGKTWYFTVDAVDERGTIFKWQTSSGQVMAVLTRLFVYGELPAVIHLRKSVKATRNGQHPMNATVVAVDGKGNGGS